MLMLEVNQNSSAIVTVSLFDSSGNAIAPGGASYRIVDLRSGTVIRNTTALTPAFDMDIDLTPSDTAILVPRSTEELRRILVETTYGGVPALNEIYDYLVKNIGL